MRQKNEEDQSHSSFFCLTFFCLVAETMIKAGKSQMYASPAKMEEGIESVKKNASNAAIVDLASAG